MGIPAEFDSYAVVILRRPEDAPELGEAQAEALQQRHQRHIMSLMESGAAYAGGPLEEAQGLAGEDPAVRAGQLVAESYVWWMPSGYLDLGGAELRE